MKYFITIAFLAWSFYSNAKTITLNVPDDLFPSNLTEIKGNFDGSISVRDPLVFFNGTHTRLVGSATTGTGLCALMNKNYVSHLNNNYDRYVAVSLGQNGEIDGVVVTTSTIMILVCR